MGWVAASDSLLRDPPPMLILAMVLVVGVLLGRLARAVGLPSITGQILGGVVMGPDLLHVFSHAAVQAMSPITDFALGLIGVAVGSHLHVRRLRNAHKRLVYLVVAEATVIPVLVFGFVRWGGAWATGGRLDDQGALLMAPLLASLAISTAPATVLALVKETRAKGVFVKTLIAGVALNNMACIALFEMAHEAVRSEVETGAVGLSSVVFAPLEQLAYSVLLGAAAGLGLIATTHQVVSSDRLATYSVIAILLTSGLAEYLEVSPLLSCLVLGITLANVTPDRDEIGHAVFANFEASIFAAFFTLAGLHLDFGVLGDALVVAVSLVLVRFAGKILAAQIAMRIAGATQKIRRYLGLALIPQAGVAIGLVIAVVRDPVLSSDPQLQAVRDLFVAVALGSVLCNEVIGPITTRFALFRSGEAGLDRARLIDFLHEENIVTNLEAATMEEAIETLTDVLVQTAPVPIDRDRFLASALEREREVSTCVGSGLAIPHGLLEGGEEIVGVMGISQAGMSLDAPDGRPVHCVILLATPDAARDRHLEVLAAFARAIGRDAIVRQQLYHARSPAHAWHLLHADDAADFNAFLDED